MIITVERVFSSSVVELLQLKTCRVLKLGCFVVAGRSVGHSSINGARLIFIGLLGLIKVGLSEGSCDFLLDTDLTDIVSLGGGTVVHLIL